MAQNEPTNETSNFIPGIPLTESVLNQTRNLSEIPLLDRLCPYQWRAPIAVHSPHDTDYLRIRKTASIGVSREKQVHKTPHRECGGQASNTC